MNTLKDFGTANKMLAHMASNPENVDIARFREKEKSLFNGLSEFMKAEGSKSQLFGQIAKGAFVVAGSLVAAGVGVDFLSTQMSEVVQNANADTMTAAKDGFNSLLDAGVTLGGVGGLSMLLKRSADKSIEKAEGIRDSVSNYRSNMESKVLSLKQ